MIRYYFSGIGNFDIQQKERLAQLCTHRLQSCHRDYVKQSHDWLSFAARPVNRKRVEIMLDSGAFTAWNKGGQVELEPLIEVYREMVNKYEGGLKAIWLINLDKIPGQRGRTATEAEIDDAIKVSDQNFAILQQEFGPRVLPVFHQNESRRRLREVASMAEYICISPRNDLGERYRISWAAEVHNLLKELKYQGAPVKTHGLATTGMKMMDMVPWYSADSAWWLSTAINGSVMFLHSTGIIKTVLVSERSPGRKDKNQHYVSMSRPIREYIDGRLAVHGFTYKDVAEHHTPRMLMCILEILEWLKISSTSPIPTAGLFDL